jgi:hypothetical protein
MLPLHPEDLLQLQNLLPDTPVFIVLTVFAYLTQSGLFRKIEIFETRDTARESLTVCYKTGRGSQNGNCC